MNIFLPISFNICFGCLKETKYLSVKLIIFLPNSFNICFGCSKVPSHWDGSFEYPQHVFWLRKKKINFSVHTLILVNFACLFVVCWFFFQDGLSKISFRNTLWVSKRFGSRSGLSVLVWIQTVCKGYQKTTKVTDSMERVTNLWQYPWFTVGNSWTSLIVSHFVG